MKNRYINARIANSFVEKTGPTVISYTLVYLFFIFHHGGNNSNQFLISLTATILMINSIIRYIGLKLYNKKVLKLKQVFIQNKVQIVFNSIGWMTLLFLVYFAEKPDQIGAILTTFVSFTLIANSIYVLSSVLWTNILFVTLSIFPSILKFMEEYFINKNEKFLGFIVLSVVYFFYVYRHAIRLKKEEVNFYGSEYDLKKKIQELNKAKKEIESFTINSFHNARLTSLGEMSSSIAHEINNPLAIISAHSQTLMKRTTTIDPSDLEKISKINSAAERIGKIIKTMKIFSAKQEINEIACYSLVTIIEETLALCTSRIKNLEIKLYITPNDFKVEGNFIQISQIILNLINNAIDAMEESDCSDKAITMESKKINDKIHLRVTNSGPKIPDEIEAKLFTPFFTTKSLGKGTGLGLSISKKLAENNLGLLRYEPINNQTSFLIILKSS